MEQSSAIFRPEPARLDWPYGLCLVMFCALFYLFTMSGRPPAQPDEAAYLTVRSGLETGALTLPAETPTLPDGASTARRTDASGRRVAAVGLPVLVVAWPFVATAGLLSGLLPNADAPLLGRLGYSASGAVVSALAVGLLFALARRWGCERGVAVFVALSYALAGLGWSSASGLALPLTTVLLLATVLAGDARSWWEALLAALAAVGLVLTQPLMLFVLPILAVWVAWPRPAAGLRPWRRFEWLAAALRLALFLAPIGLALVALAPSGLLNVSEPPAGQAAGGDFALNLYTLTISLGRGLLWYAPPILGGLAGFVVLVRRRPDPALLIALLALTWTVIQAAQPPATEPGIWGPLGLLPIVPLLILPVGLLLKPRPVGARISAAAGTPGQAPAWARTWRRNLPLAWPAWRVPLTRRLPLASLFCLGLALQGAAVAADPAVYVQAMRAELGPSPAESELRDSLTHSPQLGQLQTAAQVVSNTRNLSNLDRERLVWSQRVASQGGDMAVAEARSQGWPLLAFWWLWLYADGVPLINMGVISGALGLLTLLALMLLDQQRITDRLAASMAQFSAVAAKQKWYSRR